MQRRHLLCCAAFLLLVLPSTRADEGGPRPAPSIEAIRAGAAEACARIRSLSYTSETQGTTLNTARGDSQQLRNAAAIKPFARYSEVIHLLPGLDWRDDTQWERTYLVPGKMDVVWVTKRLAQTSRKESGPDRNPKLTSTFNDYYLECSGWWPPGEDAGVDGTWAGPPPQSLVAILARPELLVDPSLEVVDGRPCAVVRTADGLNALWLDIERNYCLVRRHLSVPAERLHFAYENGAFREVAPGAWLPTELTRIVHRGPDGPGVIPEDDLLIFARATRRVTELRVNEVTDNLFEPSYLPGTMIHDFDADTTTVIPGGVDLLDDSIRIARTILQRRTIPRHDRATAGQ